VGLTPKNLPLGLTCYRAKFVGSAAMLPIAESSTENSAAWGTVPFQGSWGTYLIISKLAQYELP